jgi:hypothetical protein
MSIQNRTASLFIISIFILLSFTTIELATLDNSTAQHYETPVGSNWTLDDINALAPEAVSKSGDEYTIHENITVNFGATLTIPPGTRVNFDQFKSITVWGTFLATGTENNRIMFTSSAQVPKVRDWNGIIFELRSVENRNSVISYSDIEYSNYGITCRSASPQVRNVKITNCQNGIYGDSESSPLIERTDIIDNNFWGIRLSRAETKISNCTISNNYYGIFSQNSKLEVFDCVIDNNTLYGALLKNDDDYFVRNNFVFNGQSTTNLYPGIKCENSQVLSRRNEFRGNTHAGIESVGSLVDSAHDVFTGNLAGLAITSGSDVSADNIEIRTSMEHGIRVYDSKISLSNSNITDNGWVNVDEDELYTGIYLNNATGDFYFNYIMRNAFHGMALEKSNANIELNMFFENNKDAIYVWQSSPWIKNCSFDKNLGNHVYVDSYSHPTILNYFRKEEKLEVKDETSSLSICRSISAGIRDSDNNPMEDVVLEVIEKNVTNDFEKLIMTSAPSTIDGKIKPFSFCVKMIYHNDTVILYKFSKIIAPSEIHWGLYILPDKDGYWTSPLPLEYSEGPIGFSIGMRKRPEIRLTTPASEYSGTIKGKLELEGEAWSDDSEISAVQYKIDNKNWEEGQLNPPTGNASNIYNWNFELNGRTLSSGEHTVQIIASEGYGNSTPIELIINVDNPQGETDSDGDGLTYADEMYYGTDPNSTDSDSDGLSDGIELDDSDGERTDPTNSDSDSDGLLDGEEDKNHNGRVEETETDPKNEDSDSDGVIDGQDDFPMDGTMWKSADTDDISFFRSFTFVMVIIVIILITLIALVMIKSGKIGKQVDEIKEDRSKEIEEKTPKKISRAERRTKKRIEDREKRKVEKKSTK